MGAGGGRLRREAHGVDQAKGGHETDEGRALIAKVDDHGTRLKVLEAEVGDLPTKQDIARLDGRIETVHQVGVRTERAVERIESHLMKLKEVS